MDENETLPGDTTWRLSLLAAALNDPRLTATEADPFGFERAARRLTVALGYCRLFGVDCGQLDGTLPEPIARAACRKLTTDLERWVRPSWQPPKGEPLSDPHAEIERWDQPVTAMADEWVDSPNPEEADEVAGRWLVRRTDILAAQVALAEAERAIRATAPADVEELSAAIDALDAGPLRRFDELLELPRNKEVLGTLADSTLSSNLREMLAEPHRDSLPWWLDPAKLPPPEAIKIPDPVIPLPTPMELAAAPSRASLSGNRKDGKDARELAVLAAAPSRASLSGPDSTFRRPDRAAHVRVAPEQGTFKYFVLSRDAADQRAPTRESIRVVVLDADGNELWAASSPDPNGEGWEKFDFTIPRKFRDRAVALAVRSGSPEEDWEYLPTQ